MGYQISLCCNQSQVYCCNASVPLFIICAVFVSLHLASQWPWIKATLDGPYCHLPSCNRIISVCRVLYLSSWLQDNAFASSINCYFIPEPTTSCATISLYLACHDKSSNHNASVEHVYCFDLTYHHFSADIPTSSSPPKVPILCCNHGARVGEPCRQF